VAQLAQPFSHSDHGRDAEAGTWS